jgi:hypothetical protein
MVSPNSETVVKRQIKERPILFSGPMVRALLDGTKTQTRRIIKNHDCAVCRKTCPYGVPGDRLWVRESWNLARPSLMDGKYVEECEAWGSKVPICGPVDGWSVWYSADEIDPGAPLVERYRPSIHMPRWASRITLEVTDVRVQRLQEINEDDAREEGVRYSDCAEPGVTTATVTMRDAYKTLWGEINGAKSWDENPWVWAVSFKVLP